MGKIRIKRLGGSCEGCEEIRREKGVLWKGSDVGKSRPFTARSIS